uniref:Uncharacterized protein n=1 Tax=Romanomermis culicivorax TaxID=13658 RepID=A0A915JTR1_ROMCU
MQKNQPATPLFDVRLSGSAANGTVSLSRRRIVDEKGSFKRNFFNSSSLSTSNMPTVSGSSSLDSDKVRERLAPGGISKDKKLCDYVLLIFSEQTIIDGNKKSFLKFEKARYKISFQ